MSIRTLEHIKTLKRVNKFELGKKIKLENDKEEDASSEEE